jgi:hypothetical protein
MKRTLILSLGLALFAPLALVGCGEETKKETKETTSTPGGSETKTKTETDKKTGDAK